MVKRFLEWIGLKEKIHNTQSIPPFFREGEIWWCYMGENIGVEINGKHGQFSRPVLVFKKYDRYSFFALPLSTKNKTGSWYASITFGGINQVVVLSQGRALDYRRFKEKMGELEEKQVASVAEAYSQLHLVIKK
jgi:mRNA interferase MazF